MRLSMGEMEISRTQSVCPECLTRIEAVRVARGSDVYLRKTCPEHGEFSTIIWRGEPAYSDWQRTKAPWHPPAPSISPRNGCPYDCGLCADHRQQTCAGLLDVTAKCDLGCAFCFAQSRGNGPPDPDFSVIGTWYESLLAYGTIPNVQLSGGEPTIRNDLPDIVALGRSMGFSFIQINTNGLRLAREPKFAERLKNAGLSSVFLQFDGTEDPIYETLRGRPLLEHKKAAISNCLQNDLAVVLVPTLVPGVNTTNMGQILLFALENLGVIKGVHFQPVSYFGRYPELPNDQDRITLPEVIRSVELQTDGLMKSEHFAPACCENALCSFHGNFVLLPDGRLQALTARDPVPCSCRQTSAEQAASRTRHFVSHHWASPNERSTGTVENCYSLGEWDTLLERSRTHMLCVSGMAFQDAWTLDLERLKECCIHAVGPDGRLIPFCARNLTSAGGNHLYGGRS